MDEQAQYDSSEAMPRSAKKRHQASLRKSSRKLRAQLNRLSVDYSMQAG